MATNNSINTPLISLGGPLTTTVADLTLTLTASTNVTLPTTGTLVNTAVTTLSSLSSIGTISSGTWNATVIAGQYGGTGVANTGHTITLAANLTTSGANNLTLTTTGSTNVTLPTTGTLVNTAVTTLSSLVSIGTITTGTWNATVITGQFGGTGVANTGSTITLGGNINTASSFTTSGANALTLTTTGSTNVTLPTSGTLATTSQIYNFVNNTTASITLVANTTYTNNNGASLGTYTLPATATFGDLFRIVGRGAGGWTVAQNASQNIFFGNSSTTTGTGGSLSSTNQHDVVEFMCTVNNNAFTVINALGNLTVV